jgi:hypothetical protein
MHRVWMAALCAAFALGAAAPGRAAIVEVDETAILADAVTQDDSGSYQLSLGPGAGLPAFHVTVDQGDQLLLRFNFSSTLTAPGLSDALALAFGADNSSESFSSGSVTFYDADGNATFTASGTVAGEICCGIISPVFDGVDLAGAPQAISAVSFLLNVDLVSEESITLTDARLDLAATTFSAPDLTLVPEPQTWMLMLSGLCGAGVLLRRQKGQIGATDPIAKGPATSLKANGFCTLS